MNKRGFTLMELLVYMAIVGIVVVIAGQVYSDSTKMRIRTQGMIRASQDAEAIGTLLKDDIAQMGVKSSKEIRTTVSSDSFHVERNVFIDVANGDKSSYVLGKSSSGGDSLYFRKIRFDNHGGYAATEEISWYLENTTLKRSCKSFDVKSGAEDPSCPADDPWVVEMVDGVSSFSVTPSVPKILDAAAEYVYPSASNKSMFRLVSRFDGTSYFRTEASPESGGSSILLSGFVSNYDFENDEMTTEKKVNEVYAAENGGAAGVFSDLCTRMTFYPDTSYEISFVVSRSSVYDKSQMFVPGKDHLSVGFRTTDGARIDGMRDFIFYPPMSAEMDLVTRRFPFSVANKVENACLVFDIAAYSPSMATGTLTFSELSVRKSPNGGAFDFNPGRVGDITDVDKQNVRAFRVKLSVKRNKEDGVVSVDIPVPSNGAE
ncbi:type II secretion system protein J [Fibrobacter sp. HC4]|uniref:PulJ/GspJ family protein n=1 Tax=Fibrobacter sp. HC4 TaxID=3239812 RepID=UPI002018C1B5|nr:prepilin-type N-terminal cleavage/methylation domain-containing protein [Fibrobacter succinogenes]MCL4101337.1 hypothetical protein [Fibrobacter succinogenes]MDO4945989.1 prepilin-type N-terminal cleavage/methylation domain-containing protein [Fibrobacter sp.]